LPTSSSPAKRTLPVSIIRQAPAVVVLPAPLAPGRTTILAVVDREVDVAQHLDLAVAGAEARDLEEGHQAGVPR
jgi:hypothetical protein